MVRDRHPPFPPLDLPMKYSESTISRFWAKVTKRQPEQCWPWKGGLGNKGYGKIKLEGTRIDVQSHVMAFELAHGSLPDGKIVCHTCDWPPCCNPGHLWAGTHPENHADMMKKGRNRSGAHKRPGELNPKSKMTDEQVREVKRRISLGENNTQIAGSLSVHHSTISQIRVGKTWKHIRLVPGSAPQTVSKTVVT